MLIHGNWASPRSWEQWIEHYVRRGYEVIAPSCPVRSSVSEVVEHCARIIRALGTEPMIIGHSSGGLVVELLLERGLGCAGVAIDARPAKRHHKSHSGAEAHDRAPMLFIADGRSPDILSEAGWQQLADDVLTWATDHAVRRERTSTMERR